MNKSHDITLRRKKSTIEDHTNNDNLQSLPDSTINHRMSQTVTSQRDDCKRHYVKFNKPIACTILVLVLLIVPHSIFFFFNSNNNALSLLSSPRIQQIQGESYKVLIEFNDESIITYQNDVLITSSLGPHTLTLYTTHTSQQNEALIDCPSKYWVQIIGDVLQNVEMRTKESTKFTQKERVWIGSFTVPIDGSFQLEVTKWDVEQCTTTKQQGIQDSANFANYEKSKKDVGQFHFQVMSDNIEHQVVTSLVNMNQNTNDVQIVKGAWIHVDRIQFQPSLEKINKSSTHIFSNPNKVASHIPMQALFGNNNNHDGQEGVVLRESVVTDENGFYAFQKLSNYELVCWLGSQSAEKIWNAFLSLRGQLFPHQRPFKFHYYKANSFIEPDLAWKDDTRFRKCKHIFVSLDEFEEQDTTTTTTKTKTSTISQMEYVHQVQMFIRHLLNAFDEVNTFPALIWILTTNESPMNAKYCSDPFLTQTSNHPCNDALNHLFKESSFPERVRIMDNTDISSPIHFYNIHGDAGHDKNDDKYRIIENDVYLAIALRIFVLVGYQVQKWRDVDQIGGIDGLTIKGGTIIPNFPLIRYDWSQPLSLDIQV